MQMAQLQALGDFAPMHKWDVSILKAPVGVVVPAAFNAHCLSSDVPKTDAGQTTDIWIRGLRVRQPGISAATPNLTLTFAETVDNVISQMMSDWRKQCYNITNGRQAANQEVKAILQLVRKNRQDQAIWFYTCYGVFLEDYDPTGGTLDGENSDILRPTMTISMDWFDDGPL